MENGSLFTTKDSLLCTHPTFSPASPHPRAADALRRSGNIADRHLSTRWHHVPELPASSPPRRDAGRRSRLRGRPNPCAWSASNLRRADNAWPTRPTLSAPSACDNPTVRGGTKAEILPGKYSSWRNDRVPAGDTDSPRYCLSACGRSPDPGRRRDDSRRDSSRPEAQYSTRVLVHNDGRPT